MCALRGRQPGHLNVRAVLCHFLPYKGLHPLRRCAAIPAYFAAGTICFQQTVPAAKSETPILSARPSTENVGGLFCPIYPIHPIKRRSCTMPKQKTIPELKAEIADNERQLRRSRYTLLPRALRSPSRRSRQAE